MAAGILACQAWSWGSREQRYAEMQHRKDVFLQGSTSSMIATFCGNTSHVRQGYECPEFTTNYWSHEVLIFGFAWQAGCAHQVLDSFGVLRNDQSVDLRGFEWAQHDKIKSHRSGKFVFVEFWRILIFDAGVFFPIWHLWRTDCMNQYTVYIYIQINYNVYIYIHWLIAALANPSAILPICWGWQRTSCVCARWASANLRVQHFFLELQGFGNSTLGKHIKMI